MWPEVRGEGGAASHPIPLPSVSVDTADVRPQGQVQGQRKGPWTWARWAARCQAGPGEALGLREGAHPTLCLPLSCRTQTRDLGKKKCFPSCTAGPLPVTGHRLQSDTVTPPLQPVAAVGQG